MSKEKLVKQKEEIEDIGLNVLKQYLLVEPKDITDKDVLNHLLAKAKLGMKFSKEMNVSQRAVDSNTIRIHKLTAENKEELRKALKKTLPQYYT